MTPEAAFFTVHRDLPREGPGEAADVLWALDIADVPEEARICDAACGPGADTVTLAEARPKARIDGIDKVAHFIEAARMRSAGYGRRISFYETTYTDLPGEYDFIWCAGAMYFEGFESVLEDWRQDLLQGGRVAFSEPAWVSEPPTPEAQAFWNGETHLEGPPSLNRRLVAAGWRVLGQRWLIGAPWEAYYTPMQERLDKLRADEPNEAVAAAIEEHQTEIDRWRAAPQEIAYVLFVVEPI